MFRSLSRPAIAGAHPKNPYDPQLGGHDPPVNFFLGATCFEILWACYRAPEPQNPENTKNYEKKKKAESQPPTVPEGHKHRVATPENLGKSRGPPQNPRRDPAEPSQRPRRALGETPAEPSERQISSESLAEGCAPRMVTLRNFKTTPGWPLSEPHRCVCVCVGHPALPVATLLRCDSW